MDEALAALWGCQYRAIPPAPPGPAAALLPVHRSVAHPSPAHRPPQTHLSAPYNNVFDCVKTTLRTSGARGPFQGLAPTLLRNTPANAVYLGSFEVLKDKAAAARGVAKADLPALDTVAAAGAGGLLYWQVARGGWWRARGVRGANGPCACPGSASPHRPAHAQSIPHQSSRLAIFPVDVIKSAIQSDSVTPAQRKYRGVLDAWLAGLELAQANGHDLAQIESVASFFVSRVDSEVDKRLAEVGTPEALALQGKAAYVQGRLAYQMFLEKFSGPRWEALAAHGARVQRPLWASTSTKNAAYPDTLYVDSLIGPHTVNTIPDATLEAFDDHGTVARTVDVDPAADSAAWAAVGDVVDLDEVAELLEVQGVDSFMKSFDDLIAVLTAKAAELGG